MTATSIVPPKNRFQMLARELQASLKSGLIVPTEASLEKLLHDVVDDVMSREFEELVTEFTNMAARENEPGRRAGYFKAAKMMQSRIPAKLKTVPLPD